MAVPLLDMQNVWRRCQSSISYREKICRYKRHLLIIPDPFLLYFFVANSISGKSFSAKGVGTHVAPSAGCKRAPFLSVSSHICVQKDDLAKCLNVSNGREKNWLKEPISICVFIMDASSFLLVVDSFQMLCRK
jgi:hypothetical protein